jgi:hypothetical protein
MTAEHRLVGLDLLRPWLTVNFFAFIVGGGLAGGLLRFLEQPYYETGVSAIDAAYIQASSLGVSAAIFGAVLGTMQWLVLRRAFRAGWWMPATCLGYALAGAIAGFLAGGDVSTIGPDEGPVPPVAAALVGYPLTISVLGGFQWLVLRQDVDRAARWPLGNLIGLFAGFGGSFAAVTSLGNVLPLLQPTDYPSAKAFVLIGVVAGVVYGAVTWTALAQLRRRAAPDTSATPGHSAMASTDG